VTLSRRRFLAVGGSLAAASTVGCDGVPEVLRSLGLGVDPNGPFSAPTGDAVDPVTHVLGRLGYGPRPGDRERVRALARTSEHAADAYIEEQLDAASIADRDADNAARRVESLASPLGELFEYKPQVLLADMTQAAILRATHSRRQLYEVMVRFWSDHFNIDSSKGDCRWLEAWDDREVIRRHALGRFPELLRASALSPAMLWYLDGRVNRRATPVDKANENYARELLELHTLGVHGGYTQRDVMEVARALTGWTVRAKDEAAFRLGRVEFRSELHDDGPKVVLGREIPGGLGARDIDAVLDIVALHPATAQHLATKLCRRFVADDPPTALVRRVAESFVASRGDIRPTLRTIFSSTEFQSARGTKLKRPFELVVSALRATDAETDGGKPIADYLVRMGHAPFRYPTPEGYPDDETPWLGTLLWRWRFAASLASNEIPGTRVDPAALAHRVGGDTQLAAHILGRVPTEVELRAYHDSGAGLALLLASPAFQRT
jgi:uncharacterized protein (DUF1800 family)